MAQLTWNQVQAPNMRDANILMSDAMNRQAMGGAIMAKALGDISTDIQNRRDAEYYAQMNQYANDPLGMAQALQNGAINQNGVSQTALQKGREYLSSAATNWKNNIDTAHTDMLNQQRQKYSSEVLDYKNALANNDLARATQIKNSVMSQDPSVSSEIFDGNLSFDKAKADAMMMQARAAMSGLANEERKKMSYDRYIEFLDKHSRTATNDPNFRIFDYLDTLSPSEKAYYMEGIQGGSNVWNGLLAQGILSANSLGSTTPSSTTNGASYDDGNLQFGK